MTQLDELRAEVRQVDRRLLELAAERMRLVGRIGALKKCDGIPLRDWDVERAVLEHAERAADEVALPRTLARSLLQLIITESRAEQERLTYSEYSGAAQDILVIGGRGKMGRWFCDFFAEQGHRVRAYDRAVPAEGAGAAPTLTEELAGTSYAVIAVSLDAVPGVIAEMTALRYSGTVFDIASLKGHLQPAVAAARQAGLSITSIHPMFGPSARTLSDKVICLCDCGDAEATRRVRTFFADTAATLVDLSLDEHDRIMTYVLGLSHLINIVVARVLMRSGHAYEALQLVGSTTFHQQMVTTATVIRENPRLYFAIQHLNAHAHRLYDLLRQELEAITSTVQCGDAPKFAEMMEAGRRWMDGHDVS